MKLVVFDLDGTLAGFGQPILPESLEAIRLLEQRGIRVALNSGKPIYYLCGLLRQADLNTPILLGENGACMQVGVDLPPKQFYTLPYSQAAKDSLHLLREELDKVLPHLWYQPNQVGLTPFLSTQEEVDAVARCVENCRDRLRDIDIYPQGFCYDFTPTGISKAEGLRALGKYLGISTEDMVAVGDGINDYPMFEAVGFSIGIGLPDPDRVNVNLPDIHAAMDLLLKMAGNA